MSLDAVVRSLLTTETNAAPFELDGLSRVMNLFRLMVTAVSLSVAIVARFELQIPSMLRIRRTVLGRSVQLIDGLGLAFLRVELAVLWIGLPTVSS